MGIKHATTGAGTKVTNTVWSENHVIDGDVLPDTANTYDLGNATYPFSRFHFNEWVTPAVGGGHHLYITDSDLTQRIRISNLNFTIFSIMPYANNTGYLGEATEAWKRIYAYTAIGSDQNVGLSFHVLDEPINTLFLDDINATSGAWVDEDITADTSANAKAVRLLVHLQPSVIGAANTFCDIAFRKNGVTPATVTKLRVSAEMTGTLSGVFSEHTVGLDSGQIMEYFFTCGVGWTSDVNVYVLGWWE